MLAVYGWLLLMALAGGTTWLGLLILSDEPDRITALPDSLIFLVLAGGFSWAVYGILRTGFERGPVILAGTAVIIVVFFLVLRHFFPLREVRLPGLGLVLGGLLADLFCREYLSARPGPRQVMRAVLAVLLVGLAWSAFMVFCGAIFWFATNSELAARFVSPGDAADSVYFAESGFHDRQLTLYVTERGQSLVLTQDGLGLLLQQENPVAQGGSMSPSLTVPQSLSTSLLSQPTSRAGGRIAAGWWMAGSPLR
jgi:hypothetical protein